MNKQVDAYLKVDRMREFDLRVKAAELDGYTEIEWREVPVPWLMDLVEENWSGIKDGKRECLPEYTKDWNAASKLITKMERMGLEIILVNCEGDNQKSVRVVKGVAAPFGPDETLDHPSYFRIEDAIANTQGDTMPRTITKAFVEVMLNELPKSNKEAKQARKDKINVMTDEQLRYSVARLIGFDDDSVILQDYPNDIDVAWGLVKANPDWRWAVYELNNREWCASPMKVVGIHYGKDTWKHLSEATDETAARAITKAFILAMEAND